MLNDRISALPPSRIFPWVFHLVLWAVWLGLPFLNAGDNQGLMMFSLWMLPVSLAKIPLFLLNTEWLIPRVFRKKGVGFYLLALVALIAAFSIFGQFFKVNIVPEEIRGKRTDWLWSILPVVFISAISTGYGFIVYLLNEDKKRQEEQQQRLTSELSFLRSQISPHFIFNVLNSIVYLIRSRSDQAESVTIKLSELMRYMLYTPQEEQIPLEQELDYVGNYVSLQQTRFGEDVAIRFSREGQAPEFFIEPMILIPFVENSFKHGVGMILDPVIEILSKVGEKEFTFRVRNKVAPEPAEDKDASSGIGLKNVRRRLELLYPNRHQLLIKEEDGWFDVRLTLHLKAG